MYDPARDVFKPPEDSPVDENKAVGGKRARSPENPSSPSNPPRPNKRLRSPEKPSNQASLPRIRKRIRSPEYATRDLESARPPKRPQVSPTPIDDAKPSRLPKRSRSPESRIDHAEPPRQRKRPGAASRIGQVEKDKLRQRQAEREQEQREEAKKAAAIRGVHDVVRQHYNSVPERGKEWRKTDSRIRGLRSFNNWVKSTIIQKFSPNENFTTRQFEGRDGGASEQGLLVLDVGCGKGGDLGKWQQAPQPIELYVGVDPAEVSIEQARERYAQMQGGGSRGGRGGRGGFRGGRPQRTFHGEFFARDAFGTWLGDIDIIKEVGIDESVGPGARGAVSARWGGGGFDVVSMMFCMHYAFESEAKARGMLRNVSGCLKKGGRFLGVIPNSDVLRSKVEVFHRGKTASAQQLNGDTKLDFDRKDGKDSEADDLSVPEWGNSIYRVRFPGKTPEDGVFRPPFGWKYSYFMEEAVEEVPEYVVPWEAFRA